MLKVYVGLTDSDWHEFLSTSGARDEVNFWQPSGRTRFRALQPGELFEQKMAEVGAGRSVKVVVELAVEPGRENCLGARDDRREQRLDLGRDRP